MEEGVLVVGIVSLVGFLILRLLAFLDEVANTQSSIQNNLHQLHQYDFGNKVELDDKRKYLYELNEKISKQLKIKAPPIYMQDNDTNNAVAINTGFFQAVIFEQKTFIGLNAQGLGAVLAHELYHIQQKHYLKSLTRHFFIGLSWLCLNMFGLMMLVDALKIPEPVAKSGEAVFWIVSLMMFYAGAGLIGDRISIICDRFMSRRQEIECDIFSAEATSFSDYLIEAHYFKDYEDFWLKPQTGLRAIKSQFYNTHPSWDKRIVAVASVDPINRK